MTTLESMNVQLESIDNQLHLLTKPGLLALLAVIGALENDHYNITEFSKLLAIYADLPQSMKESVYLAIMARLR